MKNWKNIAGGLMLGILFLTLWGFSVVEQKNLICSRLHISIRVTDDITFLGASDVENHLRSSRLDPVGLSLGSVDLKSIEDKLYELKEVKRANVYKSLDGVVHIYITQRKPVVRILNSNGTQFYLDEDGFPMPVSNAYTPRILVANGFLHEPVSVYSAGEIEKSEVLRNELLSDDIFRMAQYIRSHKFWDAQIQELYLNSFGEFEMVPTMGDHRILFGNANHMKEKFNKLYVFYKEGLRNMNWNRYKTINIKYKNQIVCTKK